jgi:urease accessory protein
MNNLHWLETAVDKLRAVLLNGFPPLEKEGQGGFAEGCFRQVWAANKSPSIPLFQRGIRSHNACFITGVRHADNYSSLWQREVRRDFSACSSPRGGTAVFSQLPLFQRGRAVHWKKATFSKSASYLGLLYFVFAMLSPGRAFAHTQGGEALGFISGLLHPVSGLDHVLAMVAVGLWGAQLGTPAIWILPVTFPLVMAFGGMLGLMGVTLPGTEVCIALSAMALGFMVLREAQPNLVIAAFLVGFFAIFHGHAHGTELPPGANGMLYSIGFVIATGTLHAAGVAIGIVHHWPAGRLALRAAGALVSIAGVVFLWRAIS